VNFAVDVVEAAPAGERALVELARDGFRREWTFGEVAERSARLAGALAARGMGRGDVVLTLIGNRPEWVFAIMACLRLGAVALPFGSAYKDVFAFAVVIAIMAWRPTGLIREKISERV